MYGRQCAVTREKEFPALKAAHIRPFKEEPRALNDRRGLKRMALQLGEPQSARTGS